MRHRPSQSMSAARVHTTACRCLQDGGRPAGAGAAAGPWRGGAASGAAHRADAAKLPAGGSRFDISIGGRNWREEEREPMQRRDGGRWGGGGDDSRGFAEPQNPAWNDVPARGRGRGGVEIDSWKARDGGAAVEWRAGGGAADQAGGATGSWRNDRWGNTTQGECQGWAGGAEACAESCCSCSKHSQQGASRCLQA